MNERIRELATQAILQCVDENGFLGKDKSIRINPYNYVDQAMVQEFIEKFAELIAKECVKIAYQNDIAKFTRDGMKIGVEIKEHFGVLE